MKTGITFLFGVVANLFRVALVYAVFSAAQSRFEVICFALLLLIYNQGVTDKALQSVHETVDKLETAQEVRGSGNAPQAFIPVVVTGIAFIPVVVAGIVWLYAMFRLVTAVWPGLWQ